MSKKFVSALLCFLYLQTASAASRAVETLGSDISKALAKGDLIGFRVIEEKADNQKSEITYSVEFSSGHRRRSTVTLVSKATYRFMKERWALTSVRPISRRVQFLDDDLIETEPDPRLDQRLPATKD